MAPRMEKKRRRQAAIDRNIFFSRTDKEARAKRQRDFLRDRPPPSPEQVSLGRDAVEHLKRHVGVRGLSGALASMSEVGIEVRPNVYQSADNGAWILNGIRFSRDDVRVTTGELRLNDLFSPGRPFAFMPDRDGARMRKMLVDFHLARGQGVGGLPLPEEDTKRRPPRQPENRVDWHDVSDLPTSTEVYGLLVAKDGIKPPRIMAGFMEDGAFVGVDRTPVPKGWRLEGWLDLSEGCAPGASDGQMVAASSMLLRGQGISDGLREVVRQINEHERPLERFEYRMSMGRDAWSYMKTSDMWPLANAICEPEEIARLNELDPSRRRGAIRAMCRGFDPVHAISYEEQRLTAGRHARDHLVSIRGSLDM